MIRKLLFLLIFLPSAALAQSYPNYTSTYVNDLGDLIEESTEAEIAEALTNLRDDTGVEATVLTLDSWKSFGGHDTIESFATGLFNHWGIGDAEKNDGILILVAEEERSMRIELGSGYGRSYDIYAGDVIDESFLPSFRNENYNDGIKIGTLAVIENIARRHAGGLEPPESSSSGSGNPILWIGGIFAALGAGIVWLIRKNSIGNKPCPSCGQKHLKRNREVQEAATTKSSGHGQQTIWCTNCDYRDVSTYTISRRSTSSGSSSGGSFGGGSSSGGGASGKW